MSASQIVITGASGYTGIHACRTFTEAGWEVIGVVSPHSKGRKDLAAAYVESCDLTDGEAVRHLLRRVKPEALLHLAGRNAVDCSWEQPAVTLAANLMTTVHILEGVRAIGAGRVLIVGTKLREHSALLAHAAHPYGFSKTLQVAAAQAWHHWYALPVMIAEPSNLIGPGLSAGLCGKITRWAVAVEESREAIQPFTLSSLHESRDFLDVRDAVSAYQTILSAGTSGQCYTVESGAKRTLSEVRQTFDEAAAAVLPWAIGQQSPNSVLVPFERDASLIRKLGWQPAYSFRQSIHDALEDERTRKRIERGSSLSDQSLS